MIILLIIISVLGLVQFGWAVIVHKDSTALVAVNALRLLEPQLPKEDV